MGRLIQIAAALWNWIEWFSKAFWDGAIAAVQTLWGKWLIVATWIWAIVKYGESLLLQLVHMLGQWMFDAFDMAIPSGLLNLFSTMNYIFPLVTLIVLTIAYLNVILIMMLYRHIKSFVPGPVSGGT